MGGDPAVRSRGEDPSMAHFIKGKESMAQHKPRIEVSEHCQEKHWTEKYHGSEPSAGYMHICQGCMARSQRSPGTKLPRLQ